MKNFIKNIANLAVNNEYDVKLDSKTTIDNNLLYFIEYHQLSPYLHYFKKSLEKNVTTIDENILLKCQEQYLKNLCKYLLYIDFLKKKQPPHFLLVKGLISSKLLYNDIGLRTFNDLDIFIHHKDYDDWMQFLSENNFIKYSNNSDSFPDKIIKKYNFAQHFVNKENNIAIDLHLNISNKMHPFQFDIEDFFHNSREIDIDGLKINTFQTEQMIVYLLYHTFKHYYFKIIWFIDIYKTFKTLDYNEHKLQSLISRYNLDSIFDYYISLSSELFGDSGLKNDSELLKNYKKRSNKYLSLNQIIQGEYKTENSINRLLLPMYFLPNFKMKIKYLFNQFFPPAEILPEYYDSSTRFKYIVNRFNRILRLK